MFHYVCVDVRRGGEAVAVPYGFGACFLAARGVLWLVDVERVEDANGFSDVGKGEWEWS